MFKVVTFFGFYLVSIVIRSPGLSSNSASITSFTIYDPHRQNIPPFMHPHIRHLFPYVLIIQWRIAPLRHRPPDNVQRIGIQKLGFGQCRQVVGQVVEKRGHGGNCGEFDEAIEWLGRMGEVNAEKNADVVGRVVLTDRHCCGF